MESTINSGVLTVQQFDSFEELADIAVGWDADFRQLNAESFRSDLFQAQFGSLLLSNVRFGCHVDQRGTAPVGMRTFAVPNVDCPEIRWFGHVTGPDVLLVFPTHGEIQAFSRTGFSIATFSIPEALLEEFFERNGGPDPSRLLGSSETIVQAPHALLDELRDQLHQLQAMMLSDSGPAILGTLGGELKNRLLFALFQVLTHANLPSKLSGASSQRTLSHLFDMLRAHPQRPLRVAELCAISGASERTLQYLFKRELDMTPKAFLTGQRLHGVHRELWNSDPSTTLVMDVANHWGFWHMGQFAADYCRFFGELPSATLKRSQ